MFIMSKIAITDIIQSAFGTFGELQLQIYTKVNIIIARKHQCVPYLLFDSSLFFCNCFVWVL